jgi:hypothetical protein
MSTEYRPSSSYIIWYTFDVQGIPAIITICHLVHNWWARFTGHHLLIVSSIDLWLINLAVFVYCFLTIHDSILIGNLLVALFFNIQLIQLLYTFNLCLFVDELGLPAIVQIIFCIFIQLFILLILFIVYCDCNIFDVHGLPATNTIQFIHL